jgi:hypothetical protein
MWVEGLKEINWLMHPKRKFSIQFKNTKDLKITQNPGQTICVKNGKLQEFEGSEKYRLEKIKDDIYIFSKIE